MSQGAEQDKGTVVTNEIAAPPDESVVTSDVPKDVETPAKKPDDKAAAASDKKSDGTNSSESANDKSKVKSNREGYLARKLKRQERELAGLRKNSAKYEAQIQHLEETVEELRTVRAEKSPKPKLEDFKNEEEYAKAYAKWAKDETSNTRETSPKPAKKEPQRQSAEPAVPEEIQEFRKKGTEKLGDEFSEALEATDVAVTKDMAEYLFDTDYGPEIYVHLANNPDESLKIAKASAFRAVKMLDALEEKAKKGELDVSTDGEMHVEEPDPPQKGSPAKKTKAPKPPSSTRERSTPDNEISEEDMSMDDYAKKRLREEKESRGYY